MVVVYRVLRVQIQPHRIVPQAVVDRDQMHQDRLMKMEARPEMVEQTLELCVD